MVSLPGCYSYWGKIRYSVKIILTNLYIWSFWIETQISVVIFFSFIHSCAFRLKGIIISLLLQTVCGILIHFIFLLKLFWTSWVSRVFGLLRKCCFLFNCSLQRRNAVSCMNTTGFCAGSVFLFKEGKKGRGKIPKPFSGSSWQPKNFKKLARTLPDSSITAARHMVTISFSWDHWNQRYNFFFLILVLFLKGDINDKNHMVVGTRALISVFKHCCNNMH